MAKRKLADVLWEAANVHLRSDLYSGQSSYTCDAVNYAGGGSRANGPAVTFLHGLGLPKGADDMFDLFDAFECGEQRQGVRYMWLLLAMHVAEDEGIEIEVAQ